MIDEDLLRRISQGLEHGPLEYQKKLLSEAFHYLLDLRKQEKQEQENTKFAIIMTAVLVGLTILGTFVKLWLGE